jgi:hypothetical protein
MATPKATTTSAASPPMADLGYPAALGLTLLVEVPAWSALTRVVTAVSWARAVSVALLVNVVSHPLLWFVLVPSLEAATASTVAGVLVAEALVVAGEAVVARLVVGRDLGALMGVSLAANALSLALGSALALAG